MEINMVSIGERIKERRKELRLTQTDIKLKCGISSGALSEIENGNRTPSVITFHSLAHVLNCSMDWLATGISPEAEGLNISSCEENLLNGFRELSDEDKDELLEILKVKLRKSHRARENSLKSSLSSTTRDKGMVS